MNGVYSSITYIVQFVFAMFVGPLADLCIAHCLSVTVTRKLFTCSGMCVFCMILHSFINLTACVHVHALCIQRNLSILASLFRTPLGPLKLS